MIDRHITGWILDFSDESSPPNSLFLCQHVFNGLSASLPSILSLFSVSFAYLYSDTAFMDNNDDKMGISIMVSTVFPVKALDIKSMCRQEVGLLLINYII